MRRASLWIVLFGLIAGCSRPVDPPTPTPGSLAVLLPTFTPRSTQRMIERTPLPTFTPAPTPTPVIHIVQPGETLIDIANRYNVTLDALQAANGVLRPETLQIGQALIIPIGSGQPVPVAGGLLLPTPIPQPVTIQGMALYETPVGSIWVLGEVVNPGSASLENTQVRAALLDATGEEIVSSTAFTALDVIPGGGRSPFGVLFVAPPAGVASYHVTAIRAESSTEPGSRYMPIAIASQESALDGLLFKVRGSLVNPGSRAATQMNLVLTTYDADGRVTGYRQSSLGQGTLATGGVAEFEIALAPNGPPGALPADYSLAVEGRTAP
ncbi:MAG TPA: FxLYD domain-containing protein [Anaerolineae bacterium]|nr:FxLYD domain-containing protein [Anaerolineae bacterium]